MLGLAALMSGNPRWIKRGSEGGGEKVNWVKSLYASLAKTQPQTPQEAPSRSAVGGGTRRALERDGVRGKGLHCTGSSFDPLHEASQLPRQEGSLADGEPAHFAGSTAVRAAVA